MPSTIEFAVSLITILIGFMVWRLWGVNWIEYFKTRTGKGILKGIVLAIVFAIGLSGLSLLTGCSGTYLNNASVYAGLDVTKKPSPSCVVDTQDDRTTSNLGIRVNLYQSVDERYTSNFKTTHHSCAFSEDDAQYDSIGLEFDYKFLVR